MELNEIKDIAIELMDAVKSKGLAELSIDAKDIKIKIKGNAPVVYSAPAAPVAAPAAISAPSVSAQAAAPAVAPAEEEITGTKVKAPLVGTFYAAPSPEEPPYVEVGQSVKKAMKTMNEIAAPCDGTISRIMAESGDMVEYDQTLVVIV